MRDFVKSSGVNLLERFVQLEKWFDNYTARFQTDDPKIQRNFDLKIFHTKKVLENASFIADSLQLNDQDCYIVRASALLHDVGRFEQYKRFNTFIDKQSVDHASLGLEILEQEQPLADFPKDVVTEIKTAIQYHNKLEVPSDIDEKSQYFTRLLRDADKLDIFRVVTEYYEEQKSGVENETIVLGLPDDNGFSDHVIDDIIAGRIVKSQDLRTLNDYKLLQMAWIFDINFVISLKLIKDKKYIQEIYNTMPKHDKIITAYGIINHHLIENCKKSLKSILF